MSDHKTKLGKFADWTLGLVALVSLLLFGRAEAALAEAPTDTDSIVQAGGGVAYVDVDETDSDSGGDGTVSE
jgi:hypothetical protein